MRMRNFNWDNLQAVEKGMVVKFKFRDGSTKTGVVYLHESFCFGVGTIVKCNVENGQPFSISTPIFESVESFAILKRHSPVAKCGENGTWDFVSNH